MALSGSKSVNFPGNSNYKLIVEWSGKQDIEKNQTTITLKSYFSSNSTWSIYASGRTLVTTINGSNQSTTHSINSGGGKKILLNTRTYTITHNSDGTKSTSYRVTLDCSGISISGKSLGKADTGSISITLNTIPRASDLTSSKSFTATNNYACTVKRASSNFYHKLFIMDGSSRVAMSPQFDTTLTWDLGQTVNENLLSRLGTKENINLTFALETWSGSKMIGEKTYTCTIYNPRSTTLSNGASEHNIGDIIAINLDSYRAEYTHTLKYTFGTASGTIVTGIKEGTYNWDTASIASTLYNALPNASSATLTITCDAYYGNTKVNSTSTMTKVLKVTNSNPTIANDAITYADTNSTTIGLTGNNQYIIQNRSTINVNLTKLASPKNGATIKSYACQIGDKRVVSTTLATQVFDIGTVNISSNDYVYLTVTDSRGLSTTISKPINVLEYYNPVIVPNVSRQGGFESATSIVVEVNFAPLKVNGVVKNSVQTLKYQYKRKDQSSWSTLVNMTPQSLGEGRAKATATVSLDNTYGYDIKILATDKVTGANVETFVDKGIPIMFIDTDKKSISFGDFASRSNAMEVLLEMFVDKLRIRDKSTNKAVKEEFAGTTMTIAETSGANTNFNFTGTISGSAGLKAAGSNVIKEVDLGSGRKALMFGDDCVGFAGDKLLYTHVGAFPNETWTWTSPVPLDKCPNGWVIAWSQYRDSNATDRLWGYTYISKTMLQSDPVKRGRPIGFSIYTEGGSSDVCTKFFTITNTTLKGDVDNNKGSASKKVLRYIYVW